MHLFHPGPPTVGRVPTSFTPLDPLTSNAWILRWSVALAFPDLATNVAGSPPLKHRHLAPATFLAAWNRSTRLIKLPV